MSWGLLDFFILSNHHEEDSEGGDPTRDRGRDSRNKSRSLSLLLQCISKEISLLQHDKKGGMKALKGMKTNRKKKGKTLIYGGQRGEAMV